MLRYFDNAWCWGEKTFENFHRGSLKRYSSFEMRFGGFSTILRVAGFSTIVGVARLKTSVEFSELKMLVNFAELEMLRLDVGKKSHFPFLSNKAHNLHAIVDNTKASHTPKPIFPMRTIC
jgi:hypothetical protein